LFIQEVYRWYRKTAKAELGLETVRQAKCGSVTFVQRADSGLRLNVHFHALVIDGVYVQTTPCQAPTFYEMPEPTDDDIVDIAIRVRRQVLKHLQEVGNDFGDPNAFDDFADREPLLAACAEGAVTAKVTLGERMGQQVERVLGSLPPPPILNGAQCAQVDWFNLHANSRAEADDRQRLEDLCRYAARPPISNERLHFRKDGKLTYTLKRTWSDGSTAVVYEPLDFIAKLLPWIPPPHANQILYHGVLAPAASWRDHIVPGDSTAKGEKRDRKNYTWAELMQRAFEIDVLTCEKCGGPMRLIATILDRKTIRAILTAVGLPNEPPHPAPPRDLYPEHAA